MGGKKIRGKMKFKRYIEMELQRLEDSVKYFPEYGVANTISKSYILGQIKALKWVLSKND